MNCIVSNEYASVYEWCSQQFGPCVLLLKITAVHFLIFLHFRLYVVVMYMWVFSCGDNFNKFYFLTFDGMSMTFSHGVKGFGSGGLVGWLVVCKHTNCKFTYKSFVVLFFVRIWCHLFACISISAAWNEWVESCIRNFWLLKPKIIDFSW